MRTIAQFALWLATIPCLAACESFETDEPDILLPDLPPRITIQAYLGENDSAIVARVTPSHPNHFFKWHTIQTPRGTQTPRIQPLSKAQVWIHDLTDGRKAQLAYSDEYDRSFFIPYDDFRLHPGHVYKLTATHPGFDPIHAVCKMPDKRPIAFTARRRNGDTPVSFDLQIDSHPLRYFIIAGFYQFPNNLSTPQAVFVTTADAVNGTLSLKAYANQFQPWVHFDLYEINPDFYSYMQSYNQQHLGHGRNSILSPPTAVHTNVTNGYGLLGAMTFLARTAIEQ